MLMTRATREKLAAQRAGGGAAAAKATHLVVRVRLPEGVVVQARPARRALLLPPKVFHAPCLLSCLRHLMGVLVQIRHQPLRTGAPL